jgi:hypothetical protein
MSTGESMRKKEEEEGGGRIWGNSNFQTSRAEAGHKSRAALCRRAQAGGRPPPDHTRRTQAEPQKERPT